MKPSPTLRVLITSAALGLAAFLTPVDAQDSSLAQRQFQAALDLIENGQPEQARRQLEQIVAADASGEFADDAVLELGKLDWGADRIDAIQQVPWTDASLASARSRFETLRDTYAERETASEGVWRLALLRLVPAPKSYDPDEALALASTLPVLYPESARASDALTLAAMLQLENGRLERAKALAFESLARDPESGVAPRAWLVLGLAHFAERSVPEALAAWGHARSAGAVSEGRDAAASTRALDLSTVLDRVMFGATRRAPAFAVDTSKVLTMPGRVESLASEPNGRLWAAMPREQAVVVTSASGSAAERRQVVGVEAVAIDRWGRVWTVDGSAVRTPTGEELRLPEKSDVSDLAPVSPDSAWVVDRRGRTMFRLDQGIGVAARPDLPPKAVPVALAPTFDGGAWVLTERVSALVRIDGEGLLQKKLDLDPITRNPIDVAVDRLGYIYVLDSKPAAVFVLSEDGEILHRVALPTEGDLAVSRPSAIAVDGSGRVAISDLRSKKVVWLR